MIHVLHAGMRVRLPTGNIIILLRRERASWVCEYAPGARQRGETQFTGVWLRRWGTQA